MKARSKWFNPVLVLAMVLLAALFVPQLAHAQGEMPGEFNLEAILVIVIGFASLAGTSSLVAAIVNVFKVIGLVKDGTSARWAAALNLLAFIALIAFRVFQPDLALEILDGYAGQIATIAMFVMGFVLQITGSQSAHIALSEAEVPVLGKSFSG